MIIRVTVGTDDEAGVSLTGYGNPNSHSRNCLLGKSLRYSEVQESI